VLTEIGLENFKRFKSELRVPCGQLNLFTGINSKGKSTALQPLLLFHQALAFSASDGLALRSIALNGESVQVGSFRDLQHRDRRIDPVTISFEFESADKVASARFQLQAADNEQRRALFQRIDIEQWFDKQPQQSVILGPKGPVMLDLDNSSKEIGPMVRSELRSLRYVHHVGADRMGPQEFYPRLDDPGFVTVGVRGERCAEAIAWADREQKRIEDSMLAPPSKGAEGEARTVADQSTAWLSYVFDGARVRVQEPYSTILTIEFNADGSAHYDRPTNVGFGFSYILPVIVAGLIAQPGQILVVENPEAHLHPMAQARLGEFLARVASTGVQVFVESHSEHILNSFRLAVREKVVPASNLVVLYFSDGDVPVLRIPVTEGGGVEHWPEGFFDQRLQDFVRLFGR
jgi:predicted ATPase